MKIPLKQLVAFTDDVTTIRDVIEDCKDDILPDDYRRLHFALRRLEQLREAILQTEMRIN